MSNCLCPISLNSSAYETHGAMYVPPYVTIHNIFLKLSRDVRISARYSQQKGVALTRAGPVRAARGSRRTAMTNIITTLTGTDTLS